MDKQKNMPSIETQQRMHEFFMKTSAPRLIEKKRQEAEKERQALCNTDFLEGEQKGGILK